MRKISIVTPVLNGVNFIEENIKSILKLTFPHEHIIVDGGSTDGTLEILKKYPHLIVIKQQTQGGMYYAIKEGFDIATGDYITWINCDDRMIASEYKMMIEKAYDRDYDFIVGNTTLLFIKEGNRTESLKTTMFVKYFLRHYLMPFAQPASLYKRSLYDKVGGFDLSFKVVADKDLFYRMSHLKESRFGVFKKTVVVFIKYGMSFGDRSLSLMIKEASTKKKACRFMRWTAWLCRKLCF